MTDYLQQREGGQERQGRKGQIALFLIIGILLLVAVSVVLHIRGKLTLGSMLRFQPLVDEVPAEFTPVKGLIDECIEKISIDGLTRIGLHGGYIGVMPTEQKYTSMSFRTDRGKPTEAETVALTPGSTWQVPYWYFMSTQNDCEGNCRFTSLRPPLTRQDGERSIEEQMDRFVADQLAGCTGNFDALKRQGFTVTPKGLPEAKTLVGEESVNVYVHYPLTMRSERGEQDAANFGVTIPLNLREIYALASDITDTQIEYRFLEGNALNVIGGFQGVDTDKLPPYAATDFSTQRISWNKDDIQKRIQDYLAAYTQRLRVSNTLNGESYTFDDPIQQGLYDGFVIPTNSTYPGISVEFEYFPFWPMYFSAGKGDRITGTGVAVGFPLSWLPIKQYSTAYDISYPVVVELDDPAAFHNKGYKFYFALETNVRDNTAINASYSPLDKFYIGGTSQFCDDGQRNSGEITVNVRDNAGRPVKDAAVYFNARESCLVGSTEVKEDKGIHTGTFTGAFPVGIGTLLVSHPDYLTAAQQFATQVDKAGTAIVTMFPYHTKRIKVARQSMVKAINPQAYPPKWMWVLDPASLLHLQQDEQAIVTYERTKGNPAEEDVSGSVDFTGDETKEIQLVPGTYTFTITILANGLPEIIIPKDHRGGFLGVGGADLPQTAVPNTPYYAGTTTVTATIDPSDVYSDSTMILYGLYVDLPGVEQDKRKHEDMGEIGKTQTAYSVQYADALQPRFE